ncbi:hypothetical protein T492DRAFT_1052123 [Pavlovales sp. CCMP2436]|nr:hypothetical protein T492DRAFT_1052123 [Pavlovales sp. CCMP2436]
MQHVVSARELEALVDAVQGELKDHARSLCVWFVAAHREVCPAAVVQQRTPVDHLGGCNEQLERLEQLDNLLELHVVGGVELLEVHAEGGVELVELHAELLELHVVGGVELLVELLELHVVGGVELLELHAKGGVELLELHVVGGVELLELHAEGGVELLELHVVGGVELLELHAEGGVELLELHAELLELHVMGDVELLDPALKNSGRHGALLLEPDLARIGGAEDGHELPPQERER